MKTRSKRSKASKKRKERRDADAKTEARNAYKEQQADKTREEENNSNGQGRYKPNAKELLVSVSDQPKGQEYWEMFSQSTEIMDKVTSEMGTEFLEEIKTRSIEVAPAYDRGWPGIWINYEDVFHKDGRVASLAIAIHRVKPNKYLVGVATIFALKEDEGPGEEPSPCVHWGVEIDELDEVVSAMLPGLFVAARTEFHPDLPPLNIIQV
jgi:hypothetical protein